jgi:hypothetical protein
MKMGRELSFKTAICTDYEQLLKDCLEKLDAWRQRREEVLESHEQGKKVGDELQRLQANYAKAYSQLERHEYECQLCQFVSKIGGRDFSGIASEVAERRRAN